MTDAAAMNILSLSPGAQDSLLKQYFSPEGNWGMADRQDRIYLLSEPQRFSRPGFAWYLGGICLVY